MLAVQYKSAKALHCQKREVYMRLLCELQAHKADIGGFMVRLQPACHMLELLYNNVYIFVQLWGFE